MTARDERVNVLARRYAVAGRAEKTRILDEFVAIPGFHRKHAMRRLRYGASARRSGAKASRRIYDEAVREAIVVLWEASDRICGKRLKALMPTRVEAMERQGHLKLGAEIRAAVLAMSAATIDRSLRQGSGTGWRPASPSDGAAIVGPPKYPGARLLPGFGDRFHPLPSVAQERPGLCRAEERRDRPPHRRVSPSGGPGSCRGSTRRRDCS